MLKKGLTFEQVQDLDYAQMVVNEALRCLPIVGLSKFYECTSDVTLGKYTFKKGDLMGINFKGLAHNSSQWQRPMEFLPERFDHENPLSKTPDGKRRHSHAMAAFHGGPRSCFGKTIAEISLKIVAIYMTQLFDMEFDDPSHKGKRLEASFDQSHTVPIWVRLSRRKF